MNHETYHRYATLFDSAVALNQYVTISTFGADAAEALTEWAKLRELEVREHERIAPNGVGDTRLTWRVLDVSDFARSCHITVQVQVASEPITEVA